MGNSFFVTGTDTGIGKTWSACGLIMALRQQGRTALGMKPIASGCQRTPDGLRNEDALRLQAVSSPSLPYAHVNPYAFEPPIAPHIAAQEAGVEIAFAGISELASKLQSQADHVVIEGVGGWRVPLSSDGDVAALAKALDLPVLLVVGIRLGCLNHALLSSDAIRASGLPLAGWIANRVDPESARFEKNLHTLQNAIPAPCLGVIPFLSDYQPQVIATYLKLEYLTD